MLLYYLIERSKHTSPSTECCFFGFIFFFCYFTEQNTLRVSHRAQRRICRSVSRSMASTACARPVSLLYYYAFVVHTHTAHSHTYNDRVTTRRYYTHTYTAHDTANPVHHSPIRPLADGVPWPSGVWRLALCRTKIPDPERVPSRTLAALSGTARHRARAVGTGPYFIQRCGTVADRTLRGGRRVETPPPKKSPKRDPGV